MCTKWKRCDCHFSTPSLSRKRAGKIISHPALTRVRERAAHRISRGLDCQSNYSGRAVSSIIWKLPNPYPMHMTADTPGRKKAASTPLQPVRRRRSIPTKRLIWHAGRATADLPTTAFMSEPSALVHPAALPTPSCESFVASQKGEDWLLVPARHYDDGFLCANLQRPARRLLAASKGVGLTWWLSTRSTGYPARWWTSIN